MPPTFAAQPLVSNSAFSPATDKQTPQMKALSLSSMPSASAMAGTTGTETQLVHGDIWYQKEGNQIENILKSLTKTMSMNEIRTVKNNLINKVIGTTNDLRIAVHNCTNIAARNDEFLHTRSEIHHQAEARDQKTEDNERAKKRHEMFEKHFELNWFKLSLFYGPEINLNAILAYEAKMLAVGYKSIASEYTTLDCELKEIGTAIDIVASQVVATVKAKLAPLHAKAVGANLNAGIAANGDSPLG